MKPTSTSTSTPISPSTPHTPHTAHEKGWMDTLRNAYRDEQLATVVVHVNAASPGSDHGNSNDPHDEDDKFAVNETAKLQNIDEDLSYSSCHPMDADKYEIRKFNMDLSAMPGIIDVSSIRGDPDDKHYDKHFDNVHDINMNVNNIHMINDINFTRINSEMELKQKPTHEVHINMDDNINIHHMNMPCEDLSDGTGSRVTGSDLSSEDGSSINLNLWNEDYDGNPDPQVVQRLITAKHLPKGLPSSAINRIKRAKIIEEIKKLEDDDSSAASCEIFFSNICGRRNKDEFTLDDEDDVAEDDTLSRNSLIIQHDIKEGASIEASVDLESLNFQKPRRVIPYALPTDGQYQPKKTPEQLVLMLPRMGSVEMENSHGHGHGHVGATDVEDDASRESFLPLQYIPRDQPGTHDEMDENGLLAQKTYVEDDVEFTLQKYDSQPARIAQLVMSGKKSEAFDAQNESQSTWMNLSHGTEEKVDLSGFELRVTRLPDDDDPIEGDRSLKSITESADSEAEMSDLEDEPEEDGERGELEEHDDIVQVMNPVNTSMSMSMEDKEEIVAAAAAAAAATVVGPKPGEKVNYGLLSILTKEKEAQEDEDANITASAETPDAAPCFLPICGGTRNVSFDSVEDTTNIAPAPTTSTSASSNEQPAVQMATSIRNESSSLSIGLEENVSHLSNVSHDKFLKTAAPIKSESEDSNGGATNHASFDGLNNMPSSQDQGIATAPAVSESSEEGISRRGSCVSANITAVSAPSDETDGHGRSTNIRRSSTTFTDCSLNPIDSESTLESAPTLPQCQSSGTAGHLSLGLTLEGTSDIDFAKLALKTNSTEEDLEALIDVLDLTLMRTATSSYTSAQAEEIVVASAVEGVFTSVENGDKYGRIILPEEFKELCTLRDTKAIRGDHDDEIATKPTDESTKDDCPTIGEASIEDRYKSMHEDEDAATEDEDVLNASMGMNIHTNNDLEDNEADWANPDLDWAPAEESDCSSSTSSGSCSSSDYNSSLISTDASDSDTSSSDSGTEMEDSMMGTDFSTVADESTIEDSRVEESTVISAIDKESAVVSAVMTERSMDLEAAAAIVSGVADSGYDAATDFMSEVADSGMDAATAVVSVVCGKPTADAATTIMCRVVDSGKVSGMCRKSTVVSTEMEEKELDASPSDETEIKSAGEAVDEEAQGTPSDETEIKSAGEAVDEMGQGSSSDEGEAAEKDSESSQIELETSQVELTVCNVEDTEVFFDADQDLNTSDDARMKVLTPTSAHDHRTCIWTIDPPSSPRSSSPIEPSPRETVINGEPFIAESFDKDVDNLVSKAMAHLATKKIPPTPTKSTSTDLPPPSSPSSQSASAPRTSSPTKSLSPGRRSKKTRMYSSMSLTADQMREKSNSPRVRKTRTRQSLSPNSRPKKSELPSTPSRSFSSSTEPMMKTVGSSSSTPKPLGLQKSSSTNISISPVIKANSSSSVMDELDNLRLKMSKNSRRSSSKSKRSSPSPSKFTQSSLLDHVVKSENDAERIAEAKRILSPSRS